MTKKRDHLKHFPYKHPTFGTKNRPNPKAAWESSVYYWWWAYLKRNTAYLDCCANAGQGELASIYADFGDVRGDSFKDWWMDARRGVRLFAEPVADDTVRILAEGESALSLEQTLTVSVPLYLPKRFIERRFRELLTEHHLGERGRQLAKQSRAKYKFQGQPNLQGLKVTLAVYDFRQANPEMKLWEIGDRIPFLLGDKSPPWKITPTQDKVVRASLAATVSRYLKRAKEAIEFTSVGVFPRNADN